MIKKLRKFSNLTLLLATSSEQFKQDISDVFSDCKGILFFDDRSDEKILEQKYDIFLADFGCKFALDIMDRVRFSKPLVPKIVLMEDISEPNIISCINMGSYAILKTPINYDDLKLTILMAVNQSKRGDKILLDKGFYYDSYRERFYGPEGVVTLTKFEFQVLKLLLDNHTQIVSYDDIEKKVWKDKKMSIFTMRNVINKIRNKTYYEIIKNNSSKGYQIDSVK
ncbi:MAG: winged helix-turn-helix domain-containing protein [Campylobacterales bacterium]|nr:winged helix-turn-helix domain-containing protein [Campylobacterales bacterium]